MNPNTLSIEQLAGQRLMVGFEGKRFNPDLKFLIRDLKVGAIILFSQNIETPNQLKKLCRAIQEHARTNNQPPLIIAIDQEGGQVARLKKPFSEFPGNPAMKDLNDAIFFAETTAAELSEAGINMNLAPVMDVAPREMTSIMSERAFGHDPEWVSKLGLTVISHLQQHHIMAVAKHFPGIGRTAADSHIQLPSCEYSLPDLQSYDLIPFADSIAQDVAGIMLSHVMYPEIDPKWPASLSKQIADHLLRKQMGFSGVSMTDDLDMGAITQHYDIQTAVRQILRAGIDMALVCHKGPNIEIAYQEILDGLRRSQDTRARGMASVRRILALKKKYLGA
ncbi:MAG: beta-N-acetylhexosaminidase [Desulfobacterales bacterium]|jgi:beta-N-acetylhexosaminidase